MSVQTRSRDWYADRLRRARADAAAMAGSAGYREFVDMVRTKMPWRFKDAKEPETYLRGVDHHLQNFIPKLLESVDGYVRHVFDFGCGSGSASTALAMLFPEARCQGTDINAREVSVAHARAELYGVGDRCRFECIPEGQALPVPDERFDLCMCCSVLEYITDPALRKFCVQEMARVIVPGGKLFMTVPNRLYPIEIHSRRLGWNYFPKLLKARIVGSDAWQVKRLARPQVLNLHRTSWGQLLTPWTNFCLEKED